MLIGLDFDNTIVSYDRLFHRLAAERGLIPDRVPATKQAVRDFLRAAGREDDWTELQGVAYGPRITDAAAFPGVMRFLSRCAEEGVGVVVVSHKTRHPYRGPRHDLHLAAHAFLETHGFYQTSDTGLSSERVFLEPSLAAKLDRIGSLGCAAFVDDLPELLAEEAFPANTRKVLFDPRGACRDSDEYVRVNSWEHCGDILLAAREVVA
jgi:hypothetical protein